MTDALNHTTTTTYDARGRVTRVTSHDGTHTDFGYDQHGFRTSVTDPLGKTTRYVYDDYGWLKQVVDPANGVTALGLTRSRGHLLKGGYDVGYGIKQQDETDTTAVHGGV